MDQRIRFLLSESLDGEMLSRFADAFRKNRFTPKASRGFILDGVRKDSISGRFIERFESVRTLIDPFGGTVQLPSIVYETTTFRLGTTTPQIEVTNPPRSLKNFLLFLGELSGFKFSVADPKIDILMWIDDISKAVSSVTLVSIECKDVQITPSTAATISFHGNIELHREVRQFLGKRSYELERATIEFSVSARKANCTLDASGRIKISPALDDHLCSVIRQATEAQLKRAKH